MDSFQQALLSESAVTELLGVDRQAVRRWVAEGSLAVQNRDDSGEALFRARDLEPLVVGLVC